MSDRYVVEPHTPLGWHVRDTWFDGPGSVFDAPVKLVVTSEDAAQRHADRLNVEAGEAVRRASEGGA